MIGQTRKTEKEYRAVQLDSSSSLKDFSIDRKKYYKKYVLGEAVEEKENAAVTIGKLVETILLEPHEFDNKFHMSSAVTAPSELMLNFIEALYNCTKESTNEDGIVTKDFEQLSREAYTLSGFKIKYEQVMSKFIGTDAEVYYNEIRMVRSKGLIVVTSQDVNNAEKIVEELRNNEVTRDIINLTNSPRYEIHNQFQVEKYEIDGHLFKSMIDKVIVDHVEETIQFVDLKCTWNVENFYEEYYLYRRAYIQAYLYYRACVHLTMNKDSDWFGFSVKFPMFMVCDSTNYYNPLIYTLSEVDLEEAYMGFEHKGRLYPGVKKIIEDLDWALANGVWNMSRVNAINGGIVNIRG